MERRLAAILVADIVGYSRLMGRDEERTLRAVMHLRSEMIEPLVATHRGRLVKQTGDGFLIEFASAMNAIQCALQWQARTASDSEGAGGEDAMRFRIGLHLGDILIEQGDIYGEGVNIAARLEALAPPGGIALSSVVKDQVHARISADFRDQGEQRLKNIAEPIRVWLLEADGEGAAAPHPNGPGEPPQVPDTPSMAVLPFANLTGDPAQAYLALGLADQLITTLGCVPWFFVSAQAASFGNGTDQGDPVAIGRRLGVRYLVDGTLQRAGDQLRVSVRLIETAEGRQLWTGRIAGPMSDLFDLQDRLAETVIGAIEPRMRQVEIRRSLAKHGNLTAFDDYLRALPRIREMSPSELVEAERLLQDAVGKNPAYAAAHGLIAWLMTLRVPQGQSVDLDRGVFHAERAIRHGADDPDALSTGGYALGFLTFDYPLGVRYLKDSLNMNPNSSRAHDFAGWLYCYSGDPGEALAHFDHSLRLSPIDDFAFRALTGQAFALFFLGRPEEAATTARRALTANPNFTPCHRVLAAALSESGRHDEAGAVVQKLLGFYPSLTVERYSTETRFTGDGHKQRLLDALRRAGLPEG